MAVYHLRGWAFCFRLARGTFTECMADLLGFFRRKTKAAYLAENGFKKLYIIAVICLSSASCGARALHGYTAERWLSPLGLTGPLVRLGAEAASLGFIVHGLLENLQRHFVIVGAWVSYFQRFGHSRAENLSAAR